MHLRETAEPCDADYAERALPVRIQLRLRSARAQGDGRRRGHEHHRVVAQYPVQVTPYARPCLLS